MNCHEFEACLERYLADPETGEQSAARRHLGECASCRELLELARLASDPGPAAEPPPDLVARVLRETSGPSCGAAEAQLCDHLDGLLAPDDARLVEHHLAGCSDCRSLSGALAALTDDLPTLAEIRPDDRFTADVLRAILPIGARFTRWRRLVWPRWVARPRFAAEAAYAMTLIIVLIFSVPGTPLEAMPRNAVQIARTVPSGTLGQGLERLEAAATARLRSLESAEATQAVLGSWRRTIEFGSRSWERTVTLAEQAPGWATEQFRTLWTWLASLLEKADETASAADSESDEEK